MSFSFFFFQAEDGIRDSSVTGVQTCALPIFSARYVARGDGVIFFAVALRGPAVEAIGTGSPVNAVFDVVRAIELRALTGVDFIGFAAGGNFAFAANYGHASGVARFSHVNAKCSSLLHGESQIRGVNFVEIAFPQFADAEIY